MQYNPAAISNHMLFFENILPFLKFFANLGNKKIGLPERANLL